MYVLVNVLWLVRTILKMVNRLHQVVKVSLGSLRNTNDLTEPLLLHSLFEHGGVGASKDSVRTVNRSDNTVFLGTTLNAILRAQKL